MSDEPERLDAPNQQVVRGVEATPGTAAESPTAPAAELGASPAPKPKPTRGKGATAPEDAPSGVRDD